MAVWKDKQLAHELRKAVDFISTRDDLKNAARVLTETANSLDPPMTGLTKVVYDAWQSGEWDDDDDAGMCQCIVEAVVQELYDRAKALRKSGPLDSWVNVISFLEDQT